MRFSVVFAMLLGAVSAQTVAPQVEVQAAVNLDTLFDWRQPFNMTRAQFDAKLEALEKSLGKKPYVMDNHVNEPSHLFNPANNSSQRVRLSMCRESLFPCALRMLWKDGDFDYMVVHFDPPADQASFDQKLVAQLDQSTGSTHQVSPTTGSYLWHGPGFTIGYSPPKETGKLYLSIRKTKGAIPAVQETPPTSPKPTPSSPESSLVVDLDQLVDWKQPIGLTLESFDAKVQALEKETGRQLCRHTSGKYETRYFDPPRNANGPKVRYSIFGSQYYLQSAYVEWKGGEVTTIELVRLQTAGGQEIEPLLAMSRFDKMFGCKHLVESDYAYSWSTPAFRAVMVKYSDSPGYGLSFHKPIRILIAEQTGQPVMPPAAVPTPTPVAMPPVPASSSTVRQKYALDLDPLVKWDDPFSLTRESFEARMKTLSESAGGRLHEGSGSTTFIPLSLSPLDISLSLFRGRLKVKAISIKWQEPRNYRIEIDPASMTVEDETWLHRQLDSLLGGAKGRAVRYQDPTQSGAIWTANTCRLSVHKDPARSFLIQIIRPADFDPETPTTPLAANLDGLLNFSSLWTWTPDDFEKTYTPKVEKQAAQNKPPQFEWLNAGKDRARFSRKMFSNVDTKLTMFGSSIKVEEAILEFVDGKAARATVSFYNRGDSGDIEVADFDRILKTIGQNLGQVTKVAPKRQLMSANAALPVTSWMWSAPSGIALLEHNEYQAAKPEFLRLKLAAPNQADWSMGKMAVGVQRMELIKRVTKTPEGDVYIAGVPMVDQGQKGYCVAASCQRLFEYMRIPCDQHEMAKLVSVDAESGANVFNMQKSLSKIDSAFKVTFKPLVNPEQYYTAGRKRRVSEKAFVADVKAHIDRGVPLLWGLALGERPEDPPLPMGGQVSGGHMRLVIGYNLAKNQLLFTDSWGAGHELKRMAMLDAYDVTMGLYSMAPSGF